MVHFLVLVFLGGGDVGQAIFSQILLIRQKLADRLEIVLGLLESLELDFGDSAIKQGDVTAGLKLQELAESRDGGGVRADFDLNFSLFEERLRYIECRRGVMTGGGQQFQLQ